MVEIGGRPILWHVIQIYLAQGFDRFLLLTGYRGEQIERFAIESDWPDGIELSCMDTGVDTPTGGRVHHARATLGAEDFCLTYADGVADVDLAALLIDHAASGATATMTVVQPELQFGVAQLGEDGRVCGFTEKPRSEHWINGGFFCCTAEIFHVLDADAVLEREPLQRLATAGGLRAYRHQGSGECLGTYQDAVVLNDLWATGGAPWKLWS